MTAPLPILAIASAAGGCAAAMVADGVILAEAHIAAAQGLPAGDARMAERTNLEWNKDDIEALGFFKVDVLGLGMLTCIRKGFDLIKAHYGIAHTLANVPQDDPKVYKMFCDAVKENDEENGMFSKLFKLIFT